MKKRYSDSAIKRRFLSFCKVHNANPEDVLGYCEGKLSNFPYWYCDYLRYCRNEILRRIKTGVNNKIDMKEVW